MKKFAKMALATAIAGFSMAASAAVVIDTFDSNQSPLVVTTVGGTASSTALGTDMVGGSRDLFVTKTAPSTGPGASNPTSLSVADGALSFEQGGNVTSYGVARWDGVDILNNDFSFGAGGYGLNLDLSLESAFELSVFSSDADFPFTIAVFTSPTQWTALTIGSYKILAPGSTFNIDFSSFLGGNVGPLDPLLNDGLIMRTSGMDGNVDFSNVNMIEAIVNYGGLPNTDLVLLGVNAVPEPASLALVGLGLLGLGASRRRKAAK